MKIDKHKAKEFLKGYFKKEILNLEPVGKGLWSHTYFFTVDEKSLVIRFSDVRDNYERDEFAQSFVELPVPRIIKTGEIEEGYFCISERIEGEYIDELSKEDALKIIPSLFQAFDSMREIDTSGTKGFGGLDAQGIGEYETWKDYLLAINEDKSNSRNMGWSEKLSKHTELAGAFDKLYEFLRSNISFMPEIRHVIHGDMLYFNVLVKNDVISAMLDWGCIKYGDFLYDIAWFSFWSSWHKGFESIDFRELAQQHFGEIGLNVPDFEIRMDVLEVHIALDSIVFISGRGDFDQVRQVTDQALRIIDGK